MAGFSGKADEKNRLLTTSREDDKINANKRWVMCPMCGRGKVLLVFKNTKACNLPVYCKMCKKESIVNIP